MMVNCFRNVENIRKYVYDIIISPIYHTIKAEKQLQWIYLQVDKIQQFKSPSGENHLWLQPLFRVKLLLQLRGNIEKRVIEMNLQRERESYAKEGGVEEEEEIVLVNQEAGNPEGIAEIALAAGEPAVAVSYCWRLLQKLEFRHSRNTQSSASDADASCSAVDNLTASVSNINLSPNDSGTPSKMNEDPSSQEVPKLSISKEAKAEKGILILNDDVRAQFRRVLTILCRALTALNCRDSLEGLHKYAFSKYGISMVLLESCAYSAQVNTT